MDSIKKNNIEELFKELLSSYDFYKKGQSTGIQVEFYPYTTIKNTVRKRNNTIYVRISDMLENAPADVLLALGIVLFCKLKGKIPPESEKMIYKDYVNSRRIQAKAQKIRRIRGKKTLIGPIGEFHDLRESFERINNKYFKGELERPNLSWSMRKTKTRFGHHDLVFNAIVISRTLDDKRIPKYLLDYVMYHEMLHQKHGRYYKNGKNHIHTKAFKEDERRYSGCKKAKSDLKKLSAGSFFKK
jgi:predicted metal-dependent hydrolase